MKYKCNKNEVWEDKKIIAIKMVKGKWSDYKNRIPFLAIRNKLKFNDVLKKISLDCPKFKFNKNQIEFMDIWHQNEYDSLLRMNLIK